MCCSEMNAAAKPLTRERFLKTVQRKITLNKKKAEPNMRIEALLEATCRRLRSETKKQRKKDYEYDVDEEYIFEDNHEHVDKKLKIDLATSSNNSSSDILRLEDILNIDENSNKDKKLSSSLWDDPQQVEDFFKQVTNNNIVGSPLYTKEIEDFNDNDFLYSCEGTMMDDNTNRNENLSTFVTTYDVSSFTMEFDNLYKELVQNLVSVETYINSTPPSPAACS